MVRVLAVVVLVACTPPLRPPPASAPLVPSVEARAAAAPPTELKAVVPAVVDEPGFESSTPDPVRCPAPYAGQEGWVPKEEVSAEEARLMNERVGLVCSMRALPSVGDPWIREELWHREERAGCTDRRGRVVIPFVYLELRPFAESGVTLALHPDDGWVYVDRRHQRIGKALTLDCRPDEVFGGHARFLAPNGKIGFLDRERRIAIAARYDDAYPFNACRAVVCIGCHPLRWAEDAPAEARCSGDAFLIDESGKRLESVDGPDWEHCGDKQGP